MHTRIEHLAVQSARNLCLLFGWGRAHSAPPGDQAVVGASGAPCMRLRHPALPSGCFCVCIAMLRAAASTCLLLHLPVCYCCLLCRGGLMACVTATATCSRHVVWATHGGCTHLHSSRLSMCCFSCGFSLCVCMAASAVGRCLTSIWAFCVVAFASMACCCLCCSSFVLWKLLFLSWHVVTTSLPHMYHVCTCISTNWSALCISTHVFVSSSSTTTWPLSVVY